MRRGMLTSLLTMGGLVLAVWQWMRMRSRPRGFGRIMALMGEMGREMNRYMNQILSMIRRRARI
ncbi:hypothetical protein J2S00_002334 [Caldalkalibacillus uzonensis]|uniref:Uncharacterized protein n=1 Tax=Caldalkalibacillus uzonensis TaxID=353224 RepID=A0ABU0CT10_9BACI|nr:hypothetical protein [Caldalkalibacillus uzonensis]MDQ0339546.1 hypothetical protein [Caldalkalibacillus uzonensis]